MLGDTGFWALCRLWSPCRQGTIFSYFLDITHFTIKNLWMFLSLCYLSMSRLKFIIHNWLSMNTCWKTKYYKFESIITNCMHFCATLVWQVLKCLYTIEYMQALAIKTCNRVCQWIKDVENEIFLLGASPFSWWFLCKYCKHVL
jgi:hypothetical protein